MSTGESSVPGRLRESSGESSRRNRWIGVAHRPPPVAELRRGAAREHRCLGQVDHPQSRSEPPHRPQCQHWKVSSCVPAPNSHVFISNGFVFSSFRFEYLFISSWFPYHLFSIEVWIIYMKVRILLVLICLLSDLIDLNAYALDIYID